MSRRTTKQRRAATRRRDGCRMRRDPVAMLRMFSERHGVPVRRTALGYEVRTESRLFVTWPGAKAADGRPCVFAVDLRALDPMTFRLRPIVRAEERR
jgi:hypothetical protein